MDAIEKLADSVIDKLKAYFERRLGDASTAWDARLAEQHKAMADAIAAIPPAKEGANGQPGEQGAAGKDGEKGADGKSITLDEVLPLISEAVTTTVEKAVATIPAPAAGEKGDPGEVGKEGPKGADGKSVTVCDVQPLIAEQVTEIVEKTIAGLPPAPAGTNGQDGQNGEPGPPGRDAADLEILPEIDPAKSYVRGTFAQHRGGLVRSFRNTDAIGDGDIEQYGWSVVVNGVHEFALIQGDDLRTFAFGVRTTDGQVLDQKFVLPVVLDRGVFELGADYQRGDASSWDGSIWIAQEAIEKADQRPAPPLWRLSVKRGRDGKDANGHAPPPQRSVDPVRLR